MESDGKKSFRSYNFQQEIRNTETQMTKAQVFNKDINVTCTLNIHCLFFPHFLQIKWRQIMKL